MSNDASKMPHEGGSVRLETAEAEKAASALRGVPDVIGSGLLETMVGNWIEKWEVV